jgi:hypothetical protein
MKIPFKSYAITTTSVLQPAVGTTISAGITASPNAQTVAVVDSSMFNAQDHIYITFPGTDAASRIEDVVVTAVGSNTITGIFTQNHTSGAFVALRARITAIFIEATDGALGDLLIFYVNPNFITAPAAFGRQAAVPAVTGKVSCLAFLKKVGAGTQPGSFSSANNFGSNPDDLCYYWVGGTATDTYLPSADQS